MPQQYGRGFGFRGSSPPWPYVGRGRGGMPRCQYPGLTGGGYAAERAVPFEPEPASNEEITSLKAQAAEMKQQLAVMERRIKELEKQD